MHSVLAISLGQEPIIAKNVTSTQQISNFEGVPRVKISQMEIPTPDSVSAGPITPM